MSVVFVLVFAAIIIAAAFLIAFVWAVRNGQYDDTYTPSVRILFDDMVKEEKEGTKKKYRRPETGKESHNGQSQPAKPEPSNSRIGA